MPKKHQGQQKTKHPSTWGYPLKVWLVTLVLSPLLFMSALAIVRSATTHDLSRSLPFLFLMMIYGLLLLFPAVLLYWVLFLVLRYRLLSSRFKKGLLSGIGILAIWLIYYFYDQEFFSEGGFGVYSWPISYSLVLMSAGALLRMPATPEPAEKINNHKKGSKRA